MTIKDLFSPVKGFLYSLILLTTFTACDNEDEIVPQVTEELTEEVQINNWIYDTMKEVYFWTDELPSDPNKDLDPTDFFASLKSSSDRFSVIVPDYDELINSLNGVTMEAGYEFMLARVSGENEDVVAIILYVKNNSPAADANLLRGDVITHINGEKITTSNYRTLLDAIEYSHNIQYKRFDTSTKTFVPQQELNLDAVVLAENPNHMNKVITSQTGKKVGYFVYNFFSPGTDKSTTYDDEARQIIADFKAQGVNEIILDLRYNSGGSLSSAVNLASLLGKNVDETKIFSENRWNSLYQEYIEGLADGDQILRKRFINLSENIGNQLSSSKIYVLTGSRTASASELVINGLLPYMDVHIIGEKTVGKNVGSIPVDDEDNPENAYGLLPIVFQVYNSGGESNYADGFLPLADDQVKDIQLPLTPLGDTKEPLLEHALNIIDGITGRFGIDKEMEEQRSKYTVEPIESSLDKKIRTNRIIFDK